MSTQRKGTDPVFIISLQKGLADRNRLPISHVIKVLQEVRGMIIDVGREILKERGAEEPTTDFGLELVADESGVAFHKGSLTATVAITRDVEIGVLAAQTVLETVYNLGVVRKPATGAISKQLQPTEARIVHRLDRIAFLNHTAKAEAKFQVIAPKLLLVGDSAKRLRKSATFGARGVEAIRVYRLSVFAEENLMLYGRLFELKDQADAEELAGFFWGELKRDSGDVWRVQFKDEDQDVVTPLFRRQIMVSGTAHYYQTKSPKLIAYAGSVRADVDRDYETAFDELFGCEKQSFTAPLDELLKMRYGEE